jgi:hypothetical protein
MLNPALWEALELHGLTEDHMTMLLRLLDVQKNGSLTWHIVHGHLSQCDLRVTFAARRVEVRRVEESILGGASVVR